MVNGKALAKLIDPSIPKRLDWGAFCPQLVGAKRSLWAERNPRIRALTGRLLAGLKETLDPETGYRAAVRAHQNNNLKEAAEKYIQVLRVKPYHQRALKQAAWLVLPAAQKRHDYQLDWDPEKCNQKAIEYYERLIPILESRNKPADRIANCYRNLAIAQSGLGLNEEAVQSYKRLLEVKPRDASAILCLAQNARDQGNEDEYFAWAKKAVEAEGSHILARYLLGTCQDKRGMKLEALKTYRMFLALVDPCHPKRKNQVRYARQRVAALSPKASGFESALDAFNNAVDAIAKWTTISVLALVGVWKCYELFVWAFAKWAALMPFERLP